ncbi:EH signature domain-containing protein [Variovorax rhizosphaerae]|uniref:EH signature domain-containing protein n=1 Tax=Variovorax rhizosphaerae TaxID=1836200 RepID=A0ABU8WMG1_9BURK
MNDSVLQLREGLARTFWPASAPFEWDLPLDVIEKAREFVEKMHGDSAIPQIATETILEAIKRFRDSGRIEGFRELRNICLGVGAVNAAGLCVLSDPTLSDTVFRAAEGQSNPRRRVRAFQALLFAYWTFPVHASGTSEAALGGWRGLRTWLESEYRRITRRADSMPSWLVALSRHRNLLTDRPCDKYGAELLNGNASGLESARKELSIPVDSWVFEEVLLAQMRAASALRDAAFKATLTRLILLATGKAEMSVSEPLRIKCVAILVSRYSRCADTSEDVDLRDAATTTIGNPWVHRLKWQAWVRDDEGPDEGAREMVLGWLSKRLITDFFELLSADGMNERRRLTYWLRFAEHIKGGMWFALGSSTHMRLATQFTDFYKRAKDHILRLDGGGADNNAFLMRIGDYLAVEFGESGNAFYLYRWDSLSPSLVKMLGSGGARAGANISDLKNKSASLDNLSHMDAPVALKSWEQKFEDVLVPLLGWAPEQRPACVPALEAAIGATVDVKDLRRDGGALWIKELDGASTRGRRLQKMGFKFRAGRGWAKD